MRKWIILTTLSLFSFSSQALEVKSMESLVKEINYDIKEYCINYIKNADKERHEEEKFLENSLSNGNSRYKVKTENGGNNNIKNLIMSQAHTHDNKKLTLSECMGEQKIGLNNLFNQNYRNDLKTEFIACYNESLKSKDLVLPEFTNCIEDIKKKRCAPILKEEYEDPYERATEYMNCMGK